MPVWYVERMKLAKYLSEKDIPQAAFAKAIGVTQVAVSRYAKELRTPSLHIIWAIEKATKGAVSVKDWPAPARKKPAPKVSESPSTREQVA